LADLPERHAVTTFRRLSSKRVIIDFMEERPGLSQAELVWLIVWNVVGGEWNRIDLDQENARTFLLDCLRKMQGNPCEAAEAARVQLQRSLMALRRETFERIQQESPFSEQAQRNMGVLLSAWLNDGEAGFARAWAEVFPPGWEAAREQQEPIQISGDVGDCAERALEVRGAPDRKARVSAEWWYLFYTFGKSWEPGTHSTRIGKQDGTFYSVHDIHVFPNSRRTVFFRLPA
jgi:hypothetical protein